MNGLEVVVLRGTAGYMALVMAGGEALGFYAGPTRRAAARKATHAVLTALAR